MQGYLRYSGQVQDDGTLGTTNRETDGRFHSKWLNMMLPRLTLAKNLLREDGVIFVSIDDHEVHNLRLLMNEVFGEENFITAITWRRTKNKSNQANYFANVIDYILVYGRAKEFLKINKLGSENTGYNYSDEKGAYSRNTVLDKKRGQHLYNIITPKGQTLSGPWVIRQEEFQRLREANLIHWSDGKNETPYKKVYLEDTGGLSCPDNFWDSKIYGSNQDGSLDIERLFQNKTTFEFPKPVKLMLNLLRLGTSPDTEAIILVPLGVNPLRVTLPMAFLDRSI